MTFSRAHTKQIALEIKIRRAKNQAKEGKPDLKIKHADWCRDAQKGNYIMLIKQVTEECKKAQERNERFRIKLYATPFKTGAEINGTN